MDGRVAISVYEISSLVEDRGAMGGDSAMSASCASLGNFENNLLLMVSAVIFSCSARSVESVRKRRSRSRASPIAMSGASSSRRLKELGEAEWTTPRATAHDF